MDGDHSGTITVEELKDAMKRQGSPVAQDELNTLVASLDVDNSGGTALELLQGWHSCTATQASKALNSSYCQHACDVAAVMWFRISSIVGWGPSLWTMFPLSAAWCIWNAWQMSLVPCCTHPLPGACPFRKPCGCLQLLTQARCPLSHWC